MKNIDKKTVEDFGEEWNKYNQSSIPDEELKKSWNQYFDMFSFEELSNDSEGFDMGCGSGRWAKFVANKVHLLNCIDPSEKALNVAKRNLSNFSNIRYFNASVNDNILKENSQDFGYCLGVLHHIPDTLEGIKACAKLLKKNAPFLLYLYYNFENRSSFYKLIWRLSDFIRKIISSLSPKTKIFITSIIAYLIYYPLARFAFISEKLGIDVSNLPLSDYRNKSFYFMKTDVLDRFGTRLEKRFSKDEIKRMLQEAGFRDIRFSKNMPFWVSISRKS
jgi:ubiquinone/menaquinone biosynthesis C-methylase UbiE